MIQRRVVKVAPPSKIAVPESTKFFSSGSKMLDLMLGGGWARARVVNIVGDKSAGKTLLAIEACANIALLWGPEQVRYAEAEEAFDEEYADRIGMPKGVKLANDIRTVEEWYADLEKWCEQQKKNANPCLYVMDSLDALSNAAELERKFDNDATYGQEKAKKTSEMFRRLIKPITDANCTLMVISQVRDNIGVTFGDKHKRSGGKALDFYCSQVLWLAQVSKIKQTLHGVDRIIGSRVLAKTKKNKVGIPYREAEVQVIFSYGVDDEQSLLDWLKKHKAEWALPEGLQDLNALRKMLFEARNRGDRTAVKDLHETLTEAVTAVWMKIENELAPAMRKYA
jgi:recombination protein RecA